MKRLAPRVIARLRASRAATFQPVATVRRKPPGRWTGDQRTWPVDHTERGLLKRSDDTVRNDEGRLVAASAPVWVTSITSTTQPGDLLEIDGRWYTVVSPERAQTYQTAAEFALEEVVYGS